MSEASATEGTILNIIHSQTRIGRVCGNAKCQAKESFGGKGVRWFLCGGCRALSYCSSECQAQDWKLHKKDCLATRAANKAKDTAPDKDKTALLGADVEVFLRAIQPFMETAGRSALKVGRKDSLRTSHALSLSFGWKPPSEPSSVNYNDVDAVRRRFTLIRGEAVEHDFDAQPERHRELGPDGKRPTDTMYILVGFTIDGVQQISRSGRDLHLPPFYHSLFEYQAEIAEGADYQPRIDLRWEANLRERIRHFPLDIELSSIYFTLFVEDTKDCYGEEYWGEFDAWTLKQPEGWIAPMMV